MTSSSRSSEASSVGTSAMPADATSTAATATVPTSARTDEHAFADPPRDAFFALARAVLFELDPERAHDLAFSLLERAPLQRLLHRRYGAAVHGADGGRPRDPASLGTGRGADGDRPRSTPPLGTRRDEARAPDDDDVRSSASRPLGIDFPNPIGLAAGFDKNGDHVDALGALGFGSLEIGTETPRPQSGNPVPRLFRLPLQRALINRMGFNNAGVDHLVRRVERRRWRGPLGINIGKNAATPLERAADDYVACLERVHPHADWVTVNISSPNTANLRALQHGDALERLLERLGSARSKLDSRHGRRVPLAVKIAPDMSDTELDDFCRIVRAHEIEAVICGNTTATRPGIADHVYAREAGGLSGAPLRTLADDRLSAVAERLAGSGIALIGVGGVTAGAHAAAKIARGADLVQLYSGLIFHGPALVRDCVAALAPGVAARRDG